jgi:hypothetical protein
MPATDILERLLSGLMGPPKDTPVRFDNPPTLKSGRHLNAPEFLTSELTKRLKSYSEYVWRSRPMDRPYVATRRPELFGLLDVYLPVPSGPDDVKTHRWLSTFEALMEQLARPKGSRQMPPLGEPEMRKI